MASVTQTIQEIGKGVNLKPYISIPSQPEKYAFDKEHFLVPDHYKDDIQSIMIPNGMVKDRIEKLAMDIYETYGDSEVHLLCVLKGSRGFFSALIEVLNRIRRYTRNHQSIPFIEHYVRIKSYEGTASTGDVRITSDDLTVLNGKHVLIIEDIIDTGHTLSAFIPHLLEFTPSSIRIASLLLKDLPEESVRERIKPDFCGFLIPPEFVIGFSLDYNEVYRDLEHISVISSAGIEKYKDH
jgi:hypoxanthine phosphoribosyltransferase